MPLKSINHSTDLSFCDYFFSLKMKTNFFGHHLGTVENMQPNWKQRQLKTSNIVSKDFVDVWFSHETILKEIKLICN